MARRWLDPGVMVVALAAAGILMVTMGSRQTFGLFVNPFNAATGAGIASISLALAVGQFSWGAIQPIAGALADRWGPAPVLLGGMLMLAVSLALTPFVKDGFGLMIMLGLLASMGSGAGGFSVLIGAASQRLPEHSRGMASGIINAGGSFGQFIYAPLAQKLIQTVGWMGSMWLLALSVLAALPLIRLLTNSRTSSPVTADSDKQSDSSKRDAVHEQPIPDSPVSGARAVDTPGMGRTVATSLTNRSYLLLHLGFFTCGFHIAFLVTHLPGEVELCALPASVASWSLSIIGLANIAGSLFAGMCISRYRSKHILAVMYASRAALVLWYLSMPREAWVFYTFAAGLGFTWLATVPPTAAIVGKLFGMRYLSTLFGLTLMSHQIGGFFGAWLGGLSIVYFGDFTWMWYADMALALMAALVNLPIREAPVKRTIAQGG